MKKNTEWSDHAGLLRQALSGNGAFLVVPSRKPQANLMTIGWGEIGVVWSRPVFTVLVRRSRYTYDCLLEADSFTINVPRNGQLSEALEVCGTKSGRDLDKASSCSLDLTEGQKVACPVIEQCALHYECSIIARKQLENEDICSPEITRSYYAGGDYHMIVIGEILSAYAEEDLD